MTVQGMGESEAIFAKERIKLPGNNISEIGRAKKIKNSSGKYVSAVKLAYLKLQKNSDRIVEKRACISEEKIILEMNGLAKQSISFLTPGLKE